MEDEPWLKYAKLRIPLEKSLEKADKTDEDLAALEELAEDVLDRMDCIPRDDLKDLDSYYELREQHQEELAAIRQERRDRGCPDRFSVKMEFNHDFSKVPWDSLRIMTAEEFKRGCPDLFMSKGKPQGVAKKTTQDVVKPVPPGKTSVPSTSTAPLARLAKTPAPSPSTVPVSRPSMSAFLPKSYEPTQSRFNSGEDDHEDAHGPFNSSRQSFNKPPSANPFQTAGEKLDIDKRKGRDTDDPHRPSRQKQSGSTNRNNYHPINPQVLFNKRDDKNQPPRIHKQFQPPDGSTNRNGQQNSPPPTEDQDDIDPRLKSCDPELISKIEMEIVDAGDPISFDDIAGLHFAKKCVNELVIWPMARPDIFTGLRSLPKGLLLFGPPGTGKTLIGKAIATQSGATFFSISASSLTSKWIGEGEKLVRTLFAVAAVKQPSVIFIDEIDSLLSQRSSTENEASRRMKTEFLVQLDGAGTKSKDIILVVGATNRPQELDEAARRRFVKRLYIPLPSAEARLDMVNRLLSKNNHNLTTEDKHYIVQRSKGFSGADVRALCTEAAMGPIRNCLDIRTMDAEEVRPISREDFEDALRGTRSSVSVKDLEFYLEWNSEFGSYQIEKDNEDDN
ncbi:hypothetical protein Ae201684P_005152 [Aphanomyces euteiches]|uniref:AAA+ ATPase domain-containing protein n=1 Tax=Aphanomyces euteiches TaxID=100861 RepID=A0A6G0X0P9_9STRA|nr:hypothetical protein Ae201684_009598 [Aphanomyces euteiches]KAH9085444.1 hypothetical protein Ae201684P_005152 [Aphanomyces euteiches]KAH9157842.1 hypothetical protein AeRB84_000314 [Aphanomyces euteiches]